MPKPWEETWDVDAGDVVRAGDGGCVFEKCYTGSLPDQPLRARLASAAPDLVRALLFIEWRGGDFWDPQVGGQCPACLGNEPSRSPDDGHHVDCALDAALRKAGVR